MVSWVCSQTCRQAAGQAGFARPGTAQPAACARSDLSADRDFGHGARGRWRGTSSIALASQTPLGQSQIATVANRRGDGRPHLPKGLHLRAQVRRSNLHSVVPRRQQGPWSALVQHGSVRQSGEGCGASYPRAGVPRTSLINRSPIRDTLAPLYQKACA